MTCPNCQAEIPAGKYCGTCGAKVSASPGSRRTWLRPSAFVAAPRENLFVPSPTSSLFPGLSRRSRLRFRLALVLLITVVIGLAGRQRAAALIAIGALWLLVLFVIYLSESGAARRLGWRPLALTGLLGGSLGAAWMLVAGGIVAQAYDIPVATSLSARHLVQQGFAIPAVGLVLLAVPAILARLLTRRKDRPQSRDVLEGFRFGGLGATAFAAGAALARYAPQFATGLLHRERPTLGLIVEAGIHGVAIPLTSAATGGLIGIALWFSWRSNSESAQHRHLRWLLIGLTALTVAALASQGMVDLHGTSELTALAIRFTFAGVSILAVRLALQATLLQQRTQPTVESSYEHRLCAQCEHVVPTFVGCSAGAFCPVCGAATAVSGHQPTKAAKKSYPAFALPEDSYTEPELKPISVAQIAIPLATTIAVTLGAVVASSTVVPEEQMYQCPPDCGQPPRGMPVAVNPRYTAPDGSFSVSYPAPNAAYEVSLDDHGVTARFTAGDTGSIRLFSKPAAGRTPRQIVKDLIQQRYPGAKVAYEVPNAMVGYESGYGEVDDFWPVGGTGAASRIRIIVLAAVKNDLALIAGANGPYHAYSPEFGPGRPTGTNLMIALDMGKYINSFTWKGDPPR